MNSALPFESTQLDAPPPDARDATSYRQQAPRLTFGHLNFMLALMCLTPIAIIALLFWRLPAVKINELSARIEILGSVPASYYRLPFAQRIYLPEIQVSITNTGIEPWTNLYVRVNHDYSVFETGEPFQPGETREYLLHRFTSKMGAFFDMRFTPVKDVMVYARLPDRSRATYQQLIDD